MPINIGLQGSSPNFVVLHINKRPMLLSDLLRRGATNRQTVVSEIRQPSPILHSTARATFFQVAYSVCSTFGVSRLEFTTPSPNLPNTSTAHTTSLGKLTPRALASSILRYFQ